MMREELKKIWRPGILAVILVLGFIFYTIYLSFYIKYFPNGPQLEGVFRVAREWVQEYGTTLEPEEEAEVAAKIPQLEAEADAYVAANPFAQQNGITTYAAFQQFYSDDAAQAKGELSDEDWARYADAQRILSYLQSEETNNIEGRLYAVKLYTQQYELWQAEGAERKTRKFYEGYTEKEFQNASTRFFGEDAAWRNILPYELPDATTSYLGYLLIWICLSVCLLLSPLLVRDRMRGMRMLQWSSQCGRRILKKQFFASMLSAFLLTTLNLLIFGSLFVAKGIRTFFPCRMFSFIHTGFSWVNWTYGGWCAVLIGLCYLVSLGIAALAFFLSQYSGNYVAMLLKMIPLCVITALICPRLISFAFYYGNRLYQAVGLPGVEAIAAGGVFCIGLILCAISIGRQKKQELKND